MSADKRSLNLDYLPHLRRVLTSPLRQHGQDGVRDVIDAMTQYDLLRDDVDAIAEISQWPGMPDAMAGVESKVRVRRTRTGAASTSTNGRSGITVSVSPALCNKPAIAD